MNNQAKVYLVEAKWFKQKYIPPIDEYITIASTSIGVKMLVVQALVGMGDVVTEDAFEWLNGNPHMLQSCAAASRFLDDIVGHKVI